jgi:SHS2 domain-containing protein
MMSVAWEHFRHGADIGVRGLGRTKADAFAEAAVALTAVVTDPASVLSRASVAVSCEAPDDEVLLIDWLNGIVYEMAVRHMLFGNFHVTIAETRLRGEACGEPIDVRRHRPAVEVKGATFTELEVAQGADGLWRAQCVLDV